jgi:hypothetical protein
VSTSVLEVTIEHATDLALLSADALVGSFAPEAAVVIDEEGKTITVEKSGGIRFYKLQSGDDTKFEITSIAINGNYVVMSYKTAGM